MAYAMRPDGLADVHFDDGSVLPMALSPDQLQAMGHAPIPARPPPRTPQFAGPGATDDDLDGLDPAARIQIQQQRAEDSAPAFSAREDEAARAALARGVERSQERKARAEIDRYQFPGSSVSDEQIAQLKGAADKGDANARRQLEGIAKNAQEQRAKGEPAGAVHPDDLAQHAEPRGAQPGAQNEPSPGVMQAFREAIGAGAGPAREQQYLKDRKQKYTLPGAVDPALAQDIGAREGELDEQQQNALSEHHYEQSQALAQQRAALEQQQRDIQQQREQRQQVNARLQDLARVRDDREREAENIKAPDVADYWKNKGVVSNIFTALSIALGGYLQGMRGGANPGLEMANQSIERWIDQQKEDYARARGKVAEANNQYKQALDLYGTPELAELDMRTRAYAVRDAMLKNQIDQIGTEDAFRQGSALLQQNQLERQQLKAQAQAKLGEKAVEDTIATRLVGGAGGGTYLRGLRAGAEAKKLEDEIYGTNPKGAETAVKLPDGSVGYAATAQDAEKLRDQAEGAADVAALARSIRRDVENMGDRADPQTRGRVLARIGALKIAIAKQHGVPIRGAGEILDAQVGSPEDIVNVRTNPGARLEALATEAEHKINTIKSHRLSPKPHGAIGTEESAEPATSERLEEE